MNAIDGRPEREVPMRLDRRPAEQADIPFLLALRESTMNEHLLASGAPVTRDAHLIRLMRHYDCAQVLLHDGQPVGLLKVRREPTVWEICQIQLSPDWQGRGVGRQLLEEILADAATLPVDVTLGVLKANRAKHLYERLGFEQVGEDAHEYFMRRRARRSCGTATTAPARA